ncbi:hypothetical protein [Nocardia beijingensis]
MTEKERAFGKLWGPGRDVSPEILAQAEAAFEEFNARPPQVHPADLPERFRDDLAGTESDEWYQQQRARHAEEWARERQQRQQGNPS